MNELLLKMLHQNTRMYPTRFAERFPRLLNKMMDLWGTNACTEFFSELLVSDRTDREGFPPDIAEEILRCSNLHDADYPPQADGKIDPWADCAFQIRMELEESGSTYSRNSMVQSVTKCDTALLKMFLKSGADVNTTDETHQRSLLMIAVINGNAVMTLLLINKNANISYLDKEGFTALHWAAYYGHTHLVTMLIEDDANPNARSHRLLTPLMQAAAQGHSETIVALLKGKANINDVAEFGWTALLKAVANKHVEATKTLLIHQANRHVAFPDGTTAIDIARRNKQEIMEQVLSVLIWR